MSKPKGKGRGGNKDKGKPKGGGKPGGRGRPHLSLNFVIGGATTTVEINPNTPLKGALSKALGKSGNQEGDSHQGWNVTGENDQAYDKDANVEELGIKDGATLFAQGKVAAGG